MINVIKVKKWVVGLLLLAAVVAGGVGIAQAATSGNFTITITVNYIAVALLAQGGGAYGTWAIGSVNGSTVSTMESNEWGLGDQGVRVANTSNVSIDLATYATNTRGWALHGTTPAEDRCVLKATSEASAPADTYPDMSGAAAVTATGSPGTNIALEVAATTDQYLYYSLTAPTSVTNPAANTITVTVEATAH